MLITTDLWQQRTQAVTDFTSQSELSGGRGLPVVAVNRWGETIRIEPPTLSRVSAVEKPDGFEFEISAHEKLRYRDVHTIDLPNGTKYQPEHGALRVDFLLDRKPAVNVFPLKLTLPKGAALHHQPALTQAEIDDGCVRPAWCVDSWACYCNGRKLGHIPRPWAKDADDNWTWGTWQRDEQAGTLAKVIPQSWLDSARYPVVIDDTFGYTTTAGTQGAWPGDWLLSFSGGTPASAQPYTPASDGDASSVHMVCDQDPSNKLCFGIYDDSGSTPNARLKDTAEGDAPTSKGWLELTLDSTLAVTNGTPYWPATHHDSAVNYYYDITSVGVYYYESAVYSAGEIRATGPSTKSGNTRQYSIYVTYTPSGGVAELFAAMQAQDNVPNRPLLEAVPYS